MLTGSSPSSGRRGGVACAGGGYFSWRGAESRKATAPPRRKASAEVVLMRISPESLIPEDFWGVLSGLGRRWDPSGGGGVECLQSMKSFSLFSTHLIWPLVLVSLTFWNIKPLQQFCFSLKCIEFPWNPPTSYCFLSCHYSIIPPPRKSINFPAVCYDFTTSGF